MANKKLFPLVQEMLDNIEKYRAEAGIDRTTFGRQCMNDGNFISRLEQGRIPHVQTFIRVENFIGRKFITPEKSK